VFPAASEDLTDLNLWEWPACLALFGVGIVTCRQGWLRAVPQRLLRQSRAVTLAGVLSMATVCGYAGRSDSLDHLLGGWSRSST
jgi:hypothetical protein